MPAIYESRDAEEDAIRTFWSWFAAHSEALLAIATSDDELLSSLLAQLHAIHPGLYFEIQVEREPLELVVTAEGRRELFPLVERIVLAAPALPAWRYVALKPAQGFDFTSEFEGVRVEPTQLWFLPLANANTPGKLGIRVGWPELQPEQHDLALTALLKALDTAIGERCLATEIHHVQ
ncbi:MAG: hypothetical protein JNM84_13485, partial [Planctomycetes bacterium]|nr:hypothetical protein [Planctomycetota bacterium]